MRFSSWSWHTGTSSIPFPGCWRVHGSLPNQSTCFVDLEKAFDCVPCAVLWGVLWEYGVRGLLLRAARSLYDRSRSLVRIAGSKSDLFPVHVGLMRSMYRSVVMKKELSCKEKLLIYRSIYVPTLTYGHELWVMTERTRSRIRLGAPLEIG